MIYHKLDWIYIVTKNFSSLLDRQLKRRDFLKQLSAFSVAAITINSQFSSSSALAQNAVTEVAHTLTPDHEIAEGYSAQMILHWGENLIGREREPFSPTTLTMKKQEKRFGYNNDYIAYLPLEKDSKNSQHGLLCVNHETVTPELMFKDYDARNPTEKQVDIQMAAVGHSVVEVEFDATTNNWQPKSGKYNRRITGFTECKFSGPAGGHSRLQTAEDPAGLLAIGTFGNCAGGITPWSSILTAEENINIAFAGDPSKSAEAENHFMMGIKNKPELAWHKYHNRFNVEKNPNEPNRFGWICEYDPYDSNSFVTKKTALGRFKHEGAEVVLNYDKRVVVYMGDDEAFQFIYKFVSKEKYNQTSINSLLLDEGTLYVAKFSDDNNVQWLPLTFGENGLTAENNFNNQGDVLIETRRAAKLLGATPMDRPEGMAYNPIKNSVHVALTNNKNRTEETLNVVNTRPKNLFGHIITLIPFDGDHASTKGQWALLAQAGNPENETHQAFYPTPPSKNGWFANPDNLHCGVDGKLWITTDGQEKSIGAADGLYYMQTKGEIPEAPVHIFNAPKGAEVTGPALTPDHRTLFLSIQHPGGYSRYDAPSTHWPHNDSSLPPYPAVMAIRRKDGDFL